MAEKKNHDMTKLVVAANKVKSGRGKQKEQGMQELLDEMQKAIPVVGVKGIAQLIDGEKEKKNEEKAKGISSE